MPDGLQNIFEPHSPKLEQGCNDLLHGLQQRTFILCMKIRFPLHFHARPAVFFMVLALFWGPWVLKSTAGPAAETKAGTVQKKTWFGPLMGSEQGTLPGLSNGSPGTRGRPDVEKGSIGPQRSG